MDYESIQQSVLQIVQSSEFIYATITGISSAIIFYEAGRLNSGYRLKRDEIFRDIDVAKSNLRSKRLELKIEEEKNSSERLKLEIDDRENQHRRKLDLIEKEREIKELDRQREQETKREDDVLRQSNLQYRRALVSDAADKLLPVLTRYIELIEKPAEKITDPDYLKEREDYKQELLDELIRSYGSSPSEIFDGSEVYEEDFDKFNRFLNEKFPLYKGSLDNLPEVSTEITELLKLILGENNLPKSLRKSD